jgi:hypothetical protein
LGTKIDLQGKRFGRWSVLSEAGPNKHGKILWECKCDCGTTRDVEGATLRSGRSQSCGCYKLQALLSRKVTHGMTRTRFYTIWQNMVRRCTNPNSTHYAHYGGRGIKVDTRWYDFINFRDDLLDKYEKHVKEFGESKTTLDRIEVNGNYEPQNVRFATRAEQAQNRRVWATSTSGVTGVHKHAQTGKWTAQIFVNGSYKYLGCYDNFDQAVEARKLSEIELGYGIVQGEVNE